MLGLSLDKNNKTRGSGVGKDNDAMSHLGEESVKEGGGSMSHLNPNKTRVMGMQLMLLC